MKALALSYEQHDMLWRHLSRDQDQVRSPEPPKPPAKYRPPVRVVSLGVREYDSRTATELPAFVYDRAAIVYTVEFQGGPLAGYVVLTIGDRQFTLECRRQDLSAVVAGSPEVERIEVFPGLWEITLRPGSSAGVTCRAITADENLTLCELFDDVDTVILNGSVIVRREFWRSVRSGGQLQTVAVVDVLPYLLGGIALGSIGLAVWSWDAGYLVSAWQCRDFSFAGDYDETADPVSPGPVDAEEPASGGEGGPGDPDPEEPPPDDPPSEEPPPPPP